MDSAKLALINQINVLQNNVLPGDLPSPASPIMLLQKVNIK